MKPLGRARRKQVTISDANGGQLRLKLAQNIQPTRSVFSKEVNGHDPAHVPRTPLKQQKIVEQCAPSFVEGTLISTQSGSCAVEDLQIGQQLWTKDAGWQPILWLGAGKACGLGVNAPVKFARGSLQNERALWLSPFQRVLRRETAVARLFGVNEVLVTAHSQINPDIVRQVPCPSVQYWQVLLAQHHILRAEGAEVESLHMAAISDLDFETEDDPDCLERFTQYFPSNASEMSSVRLLLKSCEARLLPPLRRSRRVRMLEWQVAA
jgi:hypothetical protein